MKRRERHVKSDHPGPGRKKSQVKLKDQKLFIYTIIELISSTCYGVIIDGEPTSLTEYKPFLYRAIKLITDDQVISE